MTVVAFVEFPDLLQAGHATQRECYTAAAPTVTASVAAITLRALVVAVLGVSVRYQP